MLRFSLKFATILFAMIVASEGMPSMAQNLTSKTFAEYALSTNLTPDEVYTVELLIEHVRDNFDQTYWDDWSERGDARRTPNYKPNFSPDHVGPAAEELQSLSWLSLHRGPDDERPVRDITAIKFLPRLTGLVLTNNQVMVCSVSPSFKIL